MSVETEEKMKVVYSNGSCFVWNACDAVRIREEFRIVGTLTGCLPRAPRQNMQLGVPLQLMPEEMTVLLEKGVAVLVEDVCSPPDSKQTENLQKLRQDSFQEQVKMFREDRKREMQANLPNIIAGKKAKRRKVLEEKRAQGEEVAEEEFEAEINLSLGDLPVPELQQKYSLIQIPTENMQPTEVTYQKVGWTFPHTDVEKLRYSVFKDLWEKGHFLTSGTKFGGDFLVYPGDPARFHSFYIAICMGHNEELSPLDVISIGRLGATVKKTSVLCSKNENDQLCYSSLQWTGIG